MLEVLHIENIAIIEEADIRFEAGFNALTGETGRGKSIVIDALSAVLASGQAANSSGTGRGQGVCQRGVLRCGLRHRGGAGRDTGGGRLPAAAAGDPQ